MGARAIALLLLMTYAAGAAAEDKGGSSGWLRQLADARFNVNAPGIDYPRFARFCVNVYNWGDRTFNTYDTAYVTGTGKNWKLMLRSHNWMQSYALIFNRDTRLRLRSNVYSDLGIHLSFMAVGVGLTRDANVLFGHTRHPRKTFNFNFVCALFSAGIDYSKTEGSTFITEFGDYRPSGARRLHRRFNEISQESLSGYLYYFFNHRRYSQGAAYNFSKYQLRSAGSWLAGVSVNHQRICMDFSGLPPEMTSHLPDLSTHYDFHYTDYDLMGGYGYNWVIRPRKWLVNATLLPSLGYKHTFEGTTSGRKDMFSLNGRAMFSVVYNHRNLFAALMGNAGGHVYFGNGYTFVNNNFSLSLTGGVRF